MTVVLFLISLLGAILMGIPIAFSLLTCGLVLMLQLGVYNTQIVAQNLVTGADSFSLMAIPFFILAGEIMNAGGLSARIVDLPMKLVGHKNGGLGYVAIIATVIMASLSGSAAADTAAVAAILIPTMAKAGYPRRSSTGLIAAGGIIAPIIPPSIPFIIFGVTSGVSITRLFMAGIVPGIMMGLGLMIMWWHQCRTQKFATQPKATRAQLLATLKDSVWALILPVVIIGGFRLGLFTPTEAGAVASAYALFVGLFIYREMGIKDLYHVLVAASKTVAVVMFLVAAASVSGYLMALAELPDMVANLLEPLVGSPRLLLIVIMILAAVVGMVMDLTPAVLILVPVLMPLIEMADINPVYFGVLFIINLSIGLITPPVGNVLNVITGVADIKFDQAVRGVLPYVLTHTAVLALLIAFPKLVIVPMRWLMGG